MSYKLSNFAYTNNTLGQILGRLQLCMSYKLSNFAYTNNMTDVQCYSGAVVYVLQIK